MNLNIIACKVRRNFFLIGTPESSLVIRRAKRWVTQKIQKHSQISPSKRKVKSLNQLQLTDSFTGHLTHSLAYSHSLSYSLIYSRWLTHLLIYAFSLTNSLSNKQNVIPCHHSFRRHCISSRLCTIINKSISHFHFHGHARLARNHWTSRILRSSR